MTTLREAAQQALEALEELNGWQSLAPPLASQAGRQAAISLRAALEQQKPPPEAQTEAEKIAYCAGWWAAMEQKREQPEQVVPYAVWRQGFDAVRKYKEQPEQEPVAWMVTTEMEDYMTTLPRATAQQALEALIAITTRTCAGTDGMDITPINDAFDMADTAITALKAALEQKPKFTLSCGCPSQYGGVPAYWERDGSTAFGMICEKHWHEYGARSEA